MVSIANVKYLEPVTLRQWFSQKSTNQGSQFLVVDVRDSDYIGGHIRSGLHVPSSRVGANCSAILQQMKDTKADSVVFHCALSQQRGPSAAMRFLRFLSDQDPVPDVNVYVLRGGFVNWQQLYGNDQEVTEGYDPTIWS
ncbi:hypothetical protein OGAPHI_005456 [Ogataea philodendri]|uniref:Rhodanese domain-containing protein n=1 Tax=Ogataea philodendri TaxID=1378263 RepID=A0A9P8T0X4_9ASCO|nr:uncharacterized protein OGAPHI_005456 [Ogataea philodendri]KAH3662208.1 hypothetical protein OGAPHI_005456 [Ogataea philodendri]